MKLSILSEVPKCSVFALFNPKKNKVHLMYAKNTIIKLAKLVDELKFNKHKNKELCDDLDDLELVILETYQSDDICRLHMNYWYDYVNKEGLELYGKRHNYLRYKIRVSVAAFHYDYLNKDRVDRVFVEFINGRNEGFIVGVFDNMIDANEFKSSITLNQDYLYPVYAFNELTQKEMKKKKRDSSRRRII